MAVDREKLVELIENLDSQVTVLRNRAIIWRNEEIGSVNLTSSQIDQVKTEGLNALSEIKNILDQIGTELGL